MTKHNVIFESPARCRLQFVAADSRIEVRYTLYDTSEVDLVPEVVGIYAWFFIPPLSKELIRRDLEKLEERIKLLRDQLFSTDNHKVGLHSEQRFTSKWEGSLELLSPTLDFTKVRQLGEAERHLFIDHFRLIFNMIAPVIYIGKADNLRTRLKQHHQALADVTADRPWSPNAGDEDVKGMAVRAKKAGAKDYEVDLRFTYFALPEYNDHSNKEHVNETVEGFLNRLIQPRLGRR